MRHRHAAFALVAIVLAFGCERDQPLAPSESAEPQLSSARCMLHSAPVLLGHLEALREAIEALEADGALNTGQARALRNHLGNAQRQIESQAHCPARAQLDAFRRQVDSFVRAGVLSSRQAHPLYHGERLLHEPVPFAPDEPPSYAPGVVGEIRTARLNGQEVTYEVIDGLAIYQGDMILGYADEIDDLFAAAAGAAVGSGDLSGVSPLSNHCHVSPGICDLWTDATIGYDFKNDWGDEETNQMMRERIEDAIAHWRERTGLHFVRRHGMFSGERVVFGNASGCSSWVGRKAVTGLEPQWINLSVECGLGATIHEIGHAVGIRHEHTRTDRDHHVNVDMGRVPVDKLHNYYIYHGLGHDIGRYDFMSIMHYSCTGGLGVQVITPLVENVTCEDAGDGVQIGQRATLSDGDVLSAYSLYPPELQIAGAFPGASGWEFELRAASTPRVHESFLFWSSDLVEGDIGSGSTLSIGMGDLPDGVHVIEVRAEVWGEVVARRSITLDVFDPTPSIRIVSPTSGQRFVRLVEPVPLSAEVEVHGGAAYEITWRSHALFEPFATGNDIGYPSLPYGRHVLRATVTDLERGLSTRSDPVGIYVIGTELSLRILKPSLVSSFCTSEDVEVVALAEYPGSPEVVPPSAYSWETSTHLYTTSGNRGLFRFTTAGPHGASVVVKDADDMLHSASADFQIEECEHVPPFVLISTPTHDTPALEDGFLVTGFDDERGLPYADVPLVGEAREDGRDGEPIPMDDMIWTTDRTDVQDALLGTGNDLTVRLYMAANCGGDWHDVRLTATDSRGVMRASLRRIRVWNFC